MDMKDRWGNQPGQQCDGLDSRGMMEILHPVDRSRAGGGGNDRNNALRLLRRSSDSKAKLIVFLVENGVVGIASGNPAPRDRLRGKPVRFSSKAPRQCVLK
jgi:hypothetical protein